jgi:hypothetical protein
LSKLTVGLFIRNERGGIELMSEHDYQYFGICPVVGDVICTTHLGQRGKQYYKVVERVFLDVMSYPGWALILEALAASKSLKSVAKEWTLSQEIEREFTEREAAARYEGAWDRLDRLSSESERKRYPHLFPIESELFPSRQHPPPGLRSPIQPPLETWEKRALNFLLDKPETHIPSSAIQGMGPATIKALLARGYIDAVEERNGRSRRTLICLTRKAIDDIAADKKLRCQYVFRGLD